MIELFSKTIDLGQISMDGLAVNVSRDSKGTTNLQRLAGLDKPEKKSTKKQTGKEDPGKQPSIKVAEINFSNGSIFFSDSAPKGGFKSRLNNISFKATGFSNAKDAKTLFELAVDGDSAEKITATGNAALSPLSTSARIDLKNIKLQKGWPYLQEFIITPLKGSLNIGGNLEFSEDKGLELADGGVSLNDFKAAFGNKDGIELSRLDISGITFNQKENRAEVGEVRLAKSRIALSREADGKLSPMLLLVQKPPAPAAAATAPPKPAVKDQKELAWKIKKINISGLSTIFADKTFAEPPVFRLSGIRLNTGNITGPRLSSIPLTFNAIYGNDSTIKASGTIQPAPFRYTGTAGFTKLPLRDFESYMPDNLNIFLLAGTIDSEMKLDVSMGSDGKPGGTFSGNTGIRGLHLVDSEQEEDLLKWESLQLDQINGTISPLSISIRQIALSGVYSRIAVRKDGTLNMQNLVAKQKAPESGQPPKQQEKSVVHQVAANHHQPDGTHKPHIKIDTITVQGGTMDFSDSHLPQNFRTTFHNLGGRISGLNSAMNTRAEVDLRGNLENHSPLQITGTVNPLRDDLFVDLTISFKDIELSPATPYSGRYLGYQIDKGKLFLDLKYHIENKNLKASNKLFIDQFTFGKSVKSDKATSLPVRLGVALLKDRNGQINLDLPVTGRTDDPKFSIWGVVWQVVVNLFTKAATSPFSMLSSMFGSGEDLSSINFTPGSVRLEPLEEKKLATLATALAQRPALKVEISGYIDSKRDPEGYRSELLQHKMRQEKYLEQVRSGKSAEGDDAEKIVITPDEYSRYLKAVYTKEKFPKPRNMIGMVKDLPDEEMKKLIIANSMVGDQELQQLAVSRASVVRSYLINKGKIDSHRLFQKQDNIKKQPKQENTPVSRVELNPLVQ